MQLLLTLLSITLVQIPGLMIRYLPFSQKLEKEKQKKLFFFYSIGFVFQMVVLFFLIKGDYLNLTPLTYKRLLFVLSTIYVFINVSVIKGSVYKHLFVYGMQGGYTLFIHSIVAVFVGFISDKIPVYIQFGVQSIIYTILFTLLFIPLWRRVRDSIIFHSDITNEYYWNVIWLIPALVIYSDVLVTMNTQWLNSFPQIISRVMTAMALVISWKWITLDFESLEKMLHLKNLNKVLHLQTEGILAQAHLLNESERQIKIYKHDMRHHLGIISSLIKANKLEDALQCIQNLNANMSSPSTPIIYCNNTIINAAIFVYMARAEEQGIPVDFGFSIPENLPWDSNDIAILIANIFENAIMASGHQPDDAKEIYLSARFSEDQLAIVIKNKFNGTIALDYRGFPTTTEAHHGVGMQSVLSIVDKYTAFATCSHVESWFSMTFLFLN